MSTKTPAFYDLVTEKRMVQLMAEWAKAADASITQKLVELEARLRSELGHRGGHGGVAMLNEGDYLVGPPKDAE